MQRRFAAFYSVILFLLASVAWADDNNYYIRTDMGFSSMRSEDIAIGLTSPIYPGSVSYGIHLIADPVLSGQLGLGYRFAKYFRVDVTLQQYLDRDLRGTCKPSAEELCGGQKQTSQLETVVSLLNAYVDFNPFIKDSVFSWAYPYFGIGYGFSSNNFQDIEVYQDDQYIFEVTTATQGNVAWRVMGGMGVFISQNVMLDLWYGFTNAGEAHTGTGAALATNTASTSSAHPGIMNVKFQEGFVGLRFLF